MKVEAHGDFPKEKYSQVIDICETLKRPIDKTQGMFDGSITTCCCFGAGNLKIMAMLDKNGYCPGEAINLMISVDSTNCSVDLTSVSARLATIYQAGPNPNQKVELSKLLKKYDEIVLGPPVPKKTKQFLNLVLQVPADLASDSIRTKGQTKLYHELEVVASASRASDVIVKIPITIYSLPLVNDPLPMEPEAQVLPPCELPMEMFKTY